uniref:OVATE domain-containing protein n=1 Tax=Oryza nivara TaxID=4536 RepID=A0A0E0HCR8_ORYNI
MQASSSTRPLAPSCVACGLLAPCRRALARLFRIPASAALSVRAFRFRTLRRAASKMSPRRHRHRRHPRRRTFRSVRAVFWPLVPPPPTTTASSTDQGESAAGATARSVVAPEEEAAVEEEEAATVLAPVPSPETPAYVKMVARLRSRRSGGEEEEGPCRSFEERLMEMLLEEGKVRDLQDVEELLRCWERLKSPVFVELVCRFYGELCKDLFSPGEEDGGDEGASSTTTITPAGDSS